MNLLCPNCQQMLTVPEQNAGQPMKCPLCNTTFTVPALPQPTAEPPVLKDLPTDIPLVPLPPALDAKPAPVPASPPPVHEEEHVYKLASESPRPASPPPPPPRREERFTAPPPRPASLEIPTPRPISQPQAAVTPPPPPPPAGYERSFHIWISPRVISWIAPVSLVLVFFLFFFPWVGMYPGGYAVYTQSGFQSIFGRYSSDDDAEHVLNVPKEDVDKATHANWLGMGLYFLLLLASIVLTIAPHVVTRASLQLPPAVHQLWPWRAALGVVAVLLAFLMLLLQDWSGFGLENAAVEVANKQIAENNKNETKKESEIRKGQALGRLNLRSTAWFWTVMLLQLAALIAVALELWLEKRQARPLPRIDFLC